MGSIFAKKQMVRTRY